MIISNHRLQIKKLAGLTRPSCNPALPGSQSWQDTRNTDGYLHLKNADFVGNINLPGGCIRQHLNCGECGSGRVVSPAI